VLIVLAAAAFLLSGFAALIYQIAWQRLLVLPIGADVYSTTIIVAAFMAGLGCGSLVGGRIADRLSRRHCIALFILAEVTVAAFGLASRFLYYDWMYFHVGRLQLPAGALAGLVFVSLICPTLCMGMSLPLLARAVVRSLEVAPTSVGWLYGLNTLGAAAGAFATTWLFFPALGLAGSIRLAAAVNMAAAASAALLWHRADEVSVAAPSQPAPLAAGGGDLRWSFRRWAVWYGVAGFLALSLEIVWFRLLGVMVKSSAFTFGTLLTIYLSGIAGGAALASLFLRRVRRPGKAFLVLQAFVALYAGVSISAFTTLLPKFHLLSGFWSYFASYEPFDAVSALRQLWTGGSDQAARAQFLRMYVMLPAALVGPPTLAMGASFPLLQKVALVDPGRIGNRVASVLLANIAGSTLGSIVTGWLALTYLGSAATLKLLTASAAFFLVPVLRGGVRSAAGTLRAVAVAVVVPLLAVVWLPDEAHLWQRLHGVRNQRILFGEDASGVFALRASGQGAAVLINGIRQSWIPFGDIHTVLGALPAFIHPDPRDAALIGLGSGDTLFALSGRRELARIASIEIVKPQLATLERWWKISGYAGLDAILSDPRITHVSGDGRAYVMRSGHKFDIIEADALRPTSAYSGNLYSVGYFTLLRSHLKRGGLAVTWSPTTRVQDTFTSVFPYSLSFGDVLIGSTDPLDFDPAAIIARVRRPTVQEYYARAGISIDTLLMPYLTRAPVVFREPLRTPADLNEDLFPRDEFAVRREAR
jgi:predicted membrane-bound spermidine synthase